MDGQQASRLLLDLRDIQVPDSVPWWPPAPGWWLLGLLVILLLSALLRWLYRRGAVRRAALTELHAIRQRFQSHADTGRLAADLNILLKRVALVRQPQQDCAALNGEPWLAYLDRHGQGGVRFSQGEGRWLATAPYAKESAFDAPRLLQIVEQWIRVNT